MGTADDEAVSMSLLYPDKTLPLLFQCTGGRRELGRWIADNEGLINEKLWQHGAILFRGFAVNSPEAFEQSISAASSAAWVDYREASTPRSHVAGHIFTSTEYPASRSIYLHNENSHVTSWPARLFFYCNVPSATGGETPIADCRRVLENIPTAIREKFIEKKWLYRRTFGNGVGFTWRDTFKVATREELDRYCRENFMVSEWIDDDRLVITYRRWAALRHPRTGEPSWFNHGLFFNVWNLEPAIKRSALARLGAERMPYNTYYGDGTPIEEDVLAALHAAYERERVQFAWQANDVLMIDNMMVAHGRSSYEGERKVLVGMKEKVQCEAVARADDYQRPA